MTVARAIADRQRSRQPLSKITSGRRPAFAPGCCSRWSPLWIDPSSRTSNRLSQVLNTQAEDVAGKAITARFAAVPVDAAAGRDGSSHRSQQTPQDNQRAQAQARPDQRGRPRAQVWPESVRLRREVTSTTKLPSPTICCPAAASAADRCPRRPRCRHGARPGHSMAASRAVDGRRMPGAITKPAPRPTGGRRSTRRLHHDGVGNQRCRSVDQEVGELRSTTPRFASALVSVSTGRGVYLNRRAREGASAAARKVASLLARLQAGVRTSGRMTPAPTLGSRSRRLSSPSRRSGGHRSRRSRAPTCSAATRR